MSFIETENEIVEIEKEISKMMSDHSLVEQEKLELDRKKTGFKLEIAKLEDEMAPLKKALNLSRHNIKQKEIKKSLLVKRFWQEKR